MITGVLAGPHCLSLLSAAKTASNPVHLVDSLCLSLIAIAAGHELVSTEGGERKGGSSHNKRPQALNFVSYSSAFPPFGATFARSRASSQACFASHGCWHSSPRSCCRPSSPLHRTSALCPARASRCSSPRSSSRARRHRPLRSSTSLEPRGPFAQRCYQVLGFHLSLSHACIN